MPTIHLLIKGRVQGVFYRATAKEKAVEAGVKGWIKNTPDGNVEAIATGSRESINTFIEWCKKGPSGALVTSVEITNLEERFFNDFRISRG